ncbi:hypothetical protein K504DRAFT_373526 [Pleomassaria siparia CBS 279.74]|uniref:Zn(2)-C6 fungal-type domain-containing protein n=1 Tax=Pleomassaria siparia CBS 279.74 TaxID=1314801 RepID=A0A6G1KIB4_9PLEO|nr:hypothetical protein K504DRAFT_373526 [Pleomassaria siparia CBS 279.74]
MQNIPAKRKPHSKSRRGCLQCKQRHTKCNEVHPRCANCIRLSIDCTWRVQYRNGSPASNGSVQDISQPLQYWPSSHPHDIPTSTLPLEDMRLLHHWTTRVTSIHDANLDSPFRLWGVGAVEVALDHPFFLHGLLATSALHKSLEVTLVNRTGLLAQADAHMSIALTEYIRNLEQPSEETALPIFLLAATLFAYNMASARIEEPDSPIDAVLHCFRLLRGIREVSGAQWRQLTNSTIVRDLLSGVTDVNEIPFSSNEKFQPVLDLLQLTAQLDAPERDICTQAIENLHRTFLKTDTSSNEMHAINIFMTWPAQMSDGFLTLIQDHNPVAVLAVAYFSVLMARARSAWWLRGWPERIITASMRLLEAEQRFHEWFRWPKEQISTFS